LGESGIVARGFLTLSELSQAVTEKAGCLILVEEAFIPFELAVLREALERLPAWCDLPLIVISGHVGAVGAEIAKAFPNSGNVTLLERPINPHTLASSVHVASRAIARQREVGELIAAREQAVQLRDEFLAMLAHELRNPLAPMRNALYIMRNIKVEEPILRKNVEILDRQVSHMVRMVDDLMDVARLEHGKVALRKSRLDLNRVVASAVESCIDGAQQRSHTICLALAPHALPVQGDSVRLEQVVRNLVNNAAKFTPEPSEIRVVTHKESRTAVVSVQDNGVGFDSADAAKMFDPFIQINPTIARDAGGLGMGLTIVRRLIELHGGCVDAWSGGPGKGSTFTIELPLVSGEIDAVSASRPKRMTRPRSVVVIEDNPDIRETLRMLIAMWGHSVALANDGTSGLKLVFQMRPEVALIDIGLPGMSGYDVAREIRKILPTRRVRLIALTGYGQPSDKALALQSGFDAHLLKPVSPEALEELLSG
jgi:signal transduction histidine kinase